MRKVFNQVMNVAVTDVCMEKCQLKFREVPSFFEVKYWRWHGSHDGEVKKCCCYSLVLVDKWSRYTRHDGIS